MVPDLITVSGRESMTVDDRINLLRVDIMWLEVTRPRPPDRSVPNSQWKAFWNASGDTVHEINVTIGWSRSVIHLYDRALERGTPVAELQKGADRMLSDIECIILAWRRGGLQEYQRVRKAQRMVGL